jgi:hypothetical protein
MQYIPLAFANFVLPFDLVGSGVDLVGSGVDLVGSGDDRV